MEHIEHNIRKAVFMEFITEEQADEIRQRIQELGNIEDMVTRVSHEGIQWKYDREKRWKTFI